MEKHFLPPLLHHSNIVHLGNLVEQLRGTIPRISGTAYYVDCMGGGEANTGTSTSRSGHTLEKVHATAFAPGDGIFYKRDTTCPGTLHPQGSGADSKPITILAYGRGTRLLIAGG